MHARRGYSLFCSADRCFILLPDFLLSKLKWLNFKKQCENAVLSLDFRWCFPSLWFVLLWGFFCLLFDSQLACTTSVKQQKATDFALLQALCFLSPKFQSNLQTRYLLDSPVCW